MKIYIYDRQKDHSLHHTQPDQTCFLLLLGKEFNTGVIFQTRRAKKMADEITYKNRVYRKFPRMDGLKDLYRTQDNRVFFETAWQADGEPSRKGLYCAWEHIKVSNDGLSVHTEQCPARPTERCNHFVSPSIEGIHFLFRGLKIALCSLQSRGVYVGLKKSDVQIVLHVLKPLYAPDLQLSPDFLKKRDAAIRFLRAHKRPWAASKDLATEMDWEEQRHPGFKELVDGIAANWEQERRNEEEGEEEPPIPQAEEHPHVRAVRDAAVGLG